MDMSRAQCILGFTSSRWMDSSGGNDPKAALDKALFEQMKNVEKKKKPVSGQDGYGLKKKSDASGKEKKIVVDVNVLHEAYQFLLKELHLTPRIAKKKAEEEERGISALQLMETQSAFDFSSHLKE